MTTQEEIKNNIYKFFYNYKLIWKMLFIIGIGSIGVFFVHSGISNFNKIDLLTQTGEGLVNVIKLGIGFICLVIVIYKINSFKEEDFFK